MTDRSGGQPLHAGGLQAEGSPIPSPDGCAMNFAPRIYGRFGRCFKMLPLSLPLRRDITLPRRAYLNARHNIAGPKTAHILHGAAPGPFSRGLRRTTPTPRSIRDEGAATSSSPRRRHRSWQLARTPIRRKMCRKETKRHRQIGISCFAGGLTGR